MAYILHIDTSADTGVVALAKNGELIAMTEQTNARNHAATINNDVERIIAENHITLQEISAFCVNGGPGSYTGLRIGLATAKGYCYALSKPLMMHNRLLLLCLGEIYDKENAVDAYVGVLQAREGEYYVAGYDKSLNVLQAPQHIDTQGLSEFARHLQGKIRLSGYIDDIITGHITNADIKAENVLQPDLPSWAKYAYEEYNCNRIVSLAHIEPFYLKQVYTHKPKNIN